jgi:hypothetical protein
MTFRFLFAAWSPQFTIMIRLCFYWNYLNKQNLIVIMSPGYFFMSHGLFFNQKEIGFRTHQQKAGVCRPLPAPPKTQQRKRGTSAFTFSKRSPAF